MVEKRKSVSYWKDAARRFKANHVSMVALFIFILVLIFAFIGPKLIPYSYGDQYRSSQKLGPREFSEGEALIAKASSYFDGFYATALQPGSITAVMKGEQYIGDFRFRSSLVVILQIKGRVLEREVREHALRGTS